MVGNRANCEKSKMTSGGEKKTYNDPRKPVRT